MIWIALIGLVFITVWVVALVRRPSQLERLRQEYLARLHQPGHVAQQTLHRQLEDLASRFPGRSMEWYLSWLISDLKRDRR